MKSSNGCNVFHQYPLAGIIPYRSTMVATGRVGDLVVSSKRWQQ
jgi:hypothetical protein